MKKIGRLAEGSVDQDAQREARRYLKAFSDRVKLLSNTHAKLDVLEALAPAVTHSSRTLIFTMRKSAAEEAAHILRAASAAAGTPLEIRDLHSGISRDERAARMADFEDGYVKALVAPRVLDEGVDVPDADLGVILATSRSRRQMVQRMGRILRPKDPPRLARFAVVYVEDTIEDPRTGAHEAFLDEIVPLADDGMISRSGSNRDEVVEFLSTSTARPNGSADDLLRPIRDGDPTLGSTMPTRRKIRLPTNSDTRVLVDADDYASDSRSKGALFHLDPNCPVLAAQERRSTTTLHNAKRKRMIPCPTCIAC